jgi:hypothetical protein
MKGGKMMKRRSSLIRSFCCVLAILPALWGGIVFGATLQVPSEDYPNIQAAIDAANPGDTVSVADGNYSGTGNVNLVIQGRGINIQSENGPDNCVIDCGGSGRGFTFTGVETSDSVLSGFTVKGGKVTDNGGGILCIDGASPTIENCIITENEAKYGGGIACVNSSPTVSGCDIEANVSKSGGGGLYCSISSPKIKACSISNNQGGYYGAGVYLTGSSPTLASSLIVGNSAIYYGGGVWCSNNSSPKITNCTIAHNALTDATYGRGGAFYANNSSFSIANSVHWNNAATSGPEIYLASNSVLNVKNSDVKGGKDAVVLSSATLDWDDATTIDADPLFKGEDDYHLGAGSPCIDTGIDDGDLPETDFEGGPRVLNSAPDMGAYETRTETIVDIDIEPGLRKNVIDLRFKGIVTVAVLGSENFDARTIDPKTVLFAGAAPIRHALRDVDRDYDLDMLFYFRTQDLALDPNNPEPVLTGKTVGGVSFKGTDSVTIYRPKYKPRTWWGWPKMKHVFHKPYMHFKHYPCFGGR